MIAAKPGLKDLALTTNGVLLAGQADRCRRPASTITVSLDTLDRARFVKLTRFDQLDAVHDGIAAAAASSAASRSTPSSSAASTTTSSCRC